MANIGFSSGRPLMANAYAKPAMQKPYPVPGGRPPTDFGGMSYAKPAVMPGETPPIKPPQFAPAINDLAPTTVAQAPRPVGGLTGSRPQAKPYNPNRPRFGLRDPGGR